MIWCLVVAGWFLLLAGAAWLCDRAGRRDDDFWAGFTYRHQLEKDRRLENAYYDANISADDLKALDQWWDEWRGRHTT